jgi:hypothetical protein
MIDWSHEEDGSMQHGAAVPSRETAHKCSDILDWRMVTKFLLERNVGTIFGGDREAEANSCH